MTYKTDEEIVEEFKQWMFNDDVIGLTGMQTREIADWLTTTLEAVREEEREKITDEIEKIWQEKAGFVDIKQLLKALTTNN